MKKGFLLFLSLLVFLAFAGTAIAGTIIALRGDQRVVFIDDKSEEITGTIVTDGVGGSMGSVTPDGKMLYVANNALGQYAVLAVDLKKRAVVKSIQTGPKPKVPLVSPDGKWVGVNHSNTEHGKMVIAIIDTSDNTVKYSVRSDVINSAHKGDVSMHPIWTKDSKYFIIGNYADNTVHVIDANAGKETIKLQFDGNPHYFSITPDDKELWVLVEGKEDEAGKIAGCPEIQVFNLANLVTATPGSAPEGSFCMTLKEQEVSEGHHGAFTRDGKFYYMANRGPGPQFVGTSVNVFDAATKKQVAYLTAGGQGQGHPYMSADGKYVVITQYGSNVLTVIDASGHKIVKELPVGDGKHVGFLTFTKDGKKMFVTNREDDAVYVVDMKKLEVKKKIETSEPGRKFKSQGQVINGYFNVFEVTEKYID